MGNSNLSMSDRFTEEKLCNSAAGGRKTLIDREEVGDVAVEYAKGA